MECDAMIAQEDTELVNWILGIQRLHAGSFLQAIADAAVRADGQNYLLLRPALLQFRSKYPEYDADKQGGR
jgi:hypothetical protein